MDESSAERSQELMMNACVTVVIPARNEEQSIAKVLSAIPKNYVDHIVVCDNGSTDATATIAAQNGATVVFEAKPGYGSACLCALKSIPKDTNIVVFLDADYSDDPTEMKLILTPIIEGEFDFVLGSRVARALPGSFTPQQRFGNWLSTRLLHLFYGHRFTDLGPFRAITCRALDEMKMKDTGMGWTIEMQLKGLRHNLRMLEVPVSYRPRIGKSKISGTVIGSTRAGCKILYLIFSEMFRGK